MKPLALLLLLVGALMLPATAFAQGDGYSNVGGVSQGGGDIGPAAGGSAPTTAVRSADSGSLPFTGLELGLMLAGGALLVGAGVTLRRVSGTQRS